MTQPIPLPGTGSGKTTLIGGAEKLSSWCREIVSLRRCIQLHDWAAQQNLEALAEVIKWENDSVVYRSQLEPGSPISLESKFRVIGDPRISEAVFHSFDRGDLVRPALTFIQSEIHERLERMTGVRLLWDRDGNRLINAVVPSSLLGAMWLQFSISIQRGSHYRRCAECGKHFELAPGMARSDKQFCSDACRVRANRRRKAEAEGLGTKPAAAPAARTDTGGSRQGSGRRGRPRKNRPKA